MFLFFVVLVVFSVVFGFCLYIKTLEELWSNFPGYFWVQRRLIHFLSLEDYFPLFTLRWLLNASISMECVIQHWLDKAESVWSWLYTCCGCCQESQFASENIKCLWNPSFLGLHQLFFMGRYGVYIFPCRYCDEDFVVRTTWGISTILFGLLGHAGDGGDLGWEI